MIFVIARGSLPGYFRLSNLTQRKMKHNVGRTDRIVRLMIGMIFLLMAFYTGWYMVAMGILIILSAALRWCPAYKACGWSTCKRNAGSTS